MPTSKCVAAVECHFFQPTWVSASPNQNIHKVYKSINSTVMSKTSICTLILIPVITFVWTSHWNTLLHYSANRKLWSPTKRQFCTKGLLGLQLGELRGSRPLWWSIDFKARVCLWYMHTLFELGWSLRGCGTRGRVGKSLKFQPLWILGYTAESTWKVERKNGMRHH